MLGVRNIHLAASYVGPLVGVLWFLLISVAVV
jgi:hypothetical protein